MKNFFLKHTGPVIICSVAILFFGVFYVWATTIGEDVSISGVLRIQEPYRADHAATMRYVDDRVAGISTQLETTTRSASHVGTSTDWGFAYVSCPFGYERTGCSGDFDHYCYGTRGCDYIGSWPSGIRGCGAGAWTRSGYVLTVTAYCARIQ